MKEFDILSFDGGGSKGVMEMVLLQDVMNTVTLLTQNPDKLFKMISQKDDLFTTATERCELADELKYVQNPIHPTEVFDMMVGTSTGGLISFALVGGKKNGDGQRVPMSIQEVIEMYKLATPRIFQVSGCWAKFMNWLTNKVAGMPIFPYTQDGISGLLDEYYGNTTLKDFESKCIAAAVARRFDVNEKEGYDTLELFDTRSTVSHKVTEVLKASADAPMFFITPTYVGDVPYVDGGVGGNCPLAQAIPRMRELTKFGRLNSVLSIAPPRLCLGKIPERGQRLYWMQYFPCQMSDGYAVFMDTKKHYTEATFQRLYPKSIESEAFLMDELDVDAMIDCVETEKRMDPLYFQGILTSAIVIAARIMPQDKQLEFFQVCEVVIEWSMKKQNHETGIYIAKALNKLIKDGFLSTKASYYLGYYYFELEMFEQAKEELEKNKEDFTLSLENNVEMMNLRHKVLITLGRTHHQLSNFDIAEDYLKQALNISESDANIFIYLSKAQLELNLFNQALENASIALSKLKNDQNAWLNKAYCLLIMERFKEAIDILQIIQCTDELIKARKFGYMGYCYFNLGDFKQSLKYHEQSLQLWKSIPEDKYDPNIIESYLYAGLAYLATANYYKALKNIETGLKFATEMFAPLTSHPLIARCRCKIGYLLLEVGDYDDSLKALKKALKMQEDVYEECGKQHPTMTRTYLGLANTLLQMSRLDQALDNVQNGIAMVQKLLPGCLTHCELLISKTQILIKMDEGSKARSELDEAKTLLDQILEPGSTLPIQGIIARMESKLLIQDELLDDALIKAQASLDILNKSYGDFSHPQQALTYELLGNLMALKNDKVPAKLNFEKALELLEAIFGEHEKHPLIDRIQIQLENLNYPHKIMNYLNYLYFEDKSTKGQ